MVSARRGVVVGIGQTEFSRKSGRSEVSLALESIRAALDDAGIRPAEVDGLVTYSADTSDPAIIAEKLGLDLTYFGVTGYGGGSAGQTLRDACLAVATGEANVVAIYRAFNERSGLRFGVPMVGGHERGLDCLHVPYGNITAAQQISLWVRTYMHRYGVKNSDFAPVSVAARRYAATNPAAHFYGRPVTADDHEKSRWIVEPVLRLLDCCLESDGGVAVVITGEGRAKDCRQVAVKVLAAAQGLASAPPNRNYYSGGTTWLEGTRLLGRQLWSRAGLGPADVQAAIIYDNFSPVVLMQLEALGFCGEGEAKDFVRDGALEQGGRLPVNTNGGQMGEAYINGMNGVLEAVRQVRGTAVNQVQGLEHALVTGGGGIPTSGAILGRV